MLGRLTPGSSVFLELSSSVIAFSVRHPSHGVHRRSVYARRCSLQGGAASVNSGDSRHGGLRGRLSSLGVRSPSPGASPICRRPGLTNRADRATAPRAAPARRAALSAFAARRPHPSRPATRLRRPRRPPSELHGERDAPRRNRRGAAPPPPPIETP